MAHDDEQEHIRAAGAWENPETLGGFVDFIRTGRGANCFDIALPLISSDVQALRKCVKCRR
jgi:hypothetical protein